MFIQLYQIADNNIQYIFMYVFQILQKAINACLSKAEEAGYESITFPAIGAGHRGYPPGLVAKTMLDCMANYVKRQTNTSIRNIVILTGFEAGGKVEQVSYFQSIVYVKACFSRFRCPAM